MGGCLSLLRWSFRQLEVICIYMHEIIYVYIHPSIHIYIHACIHTLTFVKSPIHQVSTSIKTLN